jgi:hypothetical protein
MRQVISLVEMNLMEGKMMVSYPQTLVLIFAAILVAACTRLNVHAAVGYC